MIARPRPAGALLVPLLTALFLSATALHAQPRNQRPLAGRWTASLRTEGDRGTASITGTIVLVAVEGVERPTYRGSYQIPFTTIGLGPDAAPVLGTLPRADSVVIVLNPSATGERAELRGTWTRVGVEGEWRWIGREGHRGRFQLRLTPR
ncbi:MAG: hypothetical protein AB7L66_00035 [Gemmatimonadales bacterium]